MLTNLFHYATAKRGGMRIISFYLFGRRIEILIQNQSEEK
jgi:hypothetical protein